MVNEYAAHRYIEFIISSLYLMFVFLSVQIWLLWKDTDKNELKMKSFINERFFKKNCAYVFSFSIFLTIHEIFEDGFALSEVYFDVFEMLALISLVLFSYEWYCVLKTCAHKRPLRQELASFIRH